ncbi:MAG TPA: sigma-54 dependent transcriptional regulator, partial [Candidatus Fermentibacter sp.]|nr:sigma-54 dependent transcriptional regulator [Candidatus Fermentibacter sp.]
VRLYGPLDSLHVLVLGETGTGKERVARLLHQESRRAARHFIAVNCSTLSNTDLLESKLFGHVKGAFTGAIADRSGLLEDTDKGTLFLDEIGEMPLETQAKLLRVIEDGTFNRLGANQELKVNVRVVAATNRNLAGMVREGSFRIDLYYRLRELVIRMPPLRDRLCDLGQIVGTVRRFLAEEHGRKFPDLTEAQYDLLRSYSWPGNVRQLKNVLHRSYLLGIEQHLAKAVEEERAEGLDLMLNTPSTPAPEVTSPAPVYDCGRAAVTAISGEPSDTLREAMRKHAMAVLAASGGNLARTARTLDISVNTLKKLREESAND